MAPPTEPRGYPHLKAQFLAAKALYDQTGHAQRIYTLLNHHIPTNTINRIVILGTGDTPRGWIQLSMILSLATTLNLPASQIFAQEDFRLNEATGADREDVDMEKFVYLYRTYLGINYNEFEPAFGNAMDVGPVVDRISGRTLLFMPFTGMIETAAVLRFAPVLPEVVIGTQMDAIVASCKGREDKLEGFVKGFDEAHRQVLLPFLDPSKGTKWNEVNGEFHRLALYWKKK